MLPGKRAARTGRRRIEADAATYGDERRTLIKEEEKSAIVVPLLDEPVTVIISSKHWVRSRQGHGLDLSALAFKEGDSMLGKFECRTTDHCIVICDNGRVCSIPVAQLPSGRGEVRLSPPSSKSPRCRIAHALCGKSEQQLLISTGRLWFHRAWRYGGQEEERANNYQRGSGNHRRALHATDNRWWLPYPEAGGCWYSCWPK